MTSVETRNTLLRRRSRISRRATSWIARLPLTTQSAQEQLGERGRAVAERHNLSRPLGLGEHQLWVDVPAGQQAQIAVATVDDLDPGDVRQPLLRRPSSWSSIRRRATPV
jgi:hypothetical protein